MDLLLFGPFDDNVLPRETLSQRDGPFRPRPERSPTRQRHLEYERARGRLEMPHMMTAQDAKIMGEVARRYHLRDVDSYDYRHVSSAEKDYRMQPPTNAAFPRRSTIR